MKNKYLLILFLFCTLELSAIGGKIKVFIKSDASVYTSQKVTVSVELLSDAFSISNAKINFPSSSKYIVQAPKSAAYLGKSDVNGTDWQMVHYEYEIYALRAGEIEVPAFGISFSASMGYGQPQKEFELQSEAVHFTVKSPEGIKANVFALVTDNYALNTELKPKKTELIVGDAVELFVTQKAHNVPDILLRPIGYKSSTLLRVYNKEPELQSELKGKYDVSRTDSFTFVASAEGNVTLPAQQIVWWNSTSKKVQKEQIPAMTFIIKPDPKIALDAQDAKEKKWVMIAAVVILIVLLLWHFLTPFAQGYVQKRKKAYDESEKGKFDKVLKSVEGETLPQIYRGFYDWINMFEHEEKIETFKDVYTRYPKYKETFLAFETALVSTDHLDNGRLKEMLLALRESLLQEADAEPFSLNKKLNP